MSIEDNINVSICRTLNGNMILLLSISNKFNLCSFYMCRKHEIIILTSLIGGSLFKEDMATPVSAIAANAPVRPIAAHNNHPLWRLNGSLQSENQVSSKSRVIETKSNRLRINPKLRIVNFAQAIKKLEKKYHSDICHWEVA